MSLKVTRVIDVSRVLFLWCLLFSSINTSRTHKQLLGLHRRFSLLTTTLESLWSWATVSIVMLVRDEGRWCVQRRHRCRPTGQTHNNTHIQTHDSATGSPSTAPPPLLPFPPPPLLPPIQMITFPHFTPPILLLLLLPWSLTQSSPIPLLPTPRPQPQYKSPRAPTQSLALFSTTFRSAFRKSPSTTYSPRLCNRRKFL